MLRAFFLQMITPFGLGFLSAVHPSPLQSIASFGIRFSERLPNTTRAFSWQDLDRRSGRFDL